MNEDFAEKEDYEKIQLKDGDRVDFLYFMGRWCLLKARIPAQATTQSKLFLKKVYKKYNKKLIR